MSLIEMQSNINHFSFQKKKKSNIPTVAMAHSEYKKKRGIIAKSKKKLKIFNEKIQDSNFFSDIATEFTTNSNNLLEFDIKKHQKKNR